MPFKSLVHKSLYSHFHVLSNDSILNGLCFLAVPLFDKFCSVVVRPPPLRSKETALPESKSNFSKLALAAPNCWKNDVCGSGVGLKCLPEWASDVELSELLIPSAPDGARSLPVIEKSSGPESLHESPPTTSIMHSSPSPSPSESEYMPLFRCCARYSVFKASRSTVMPLARSFLACLSNAFASFFLLLALLRYRAKLV